MAERELSLNLSDDAKDLLVEKGWDPSMGARPLRRAIQRYIEDPLADEVLGTGMAEGSTIDVDRAPEEERSEEHEVKITIHKPKKKAREPVGVGAKGDEAGEGDKPDEDRPSGEGPDEGGLPEDPEVLPEIPDAPPAADSPPEDDKS